MSLEKLKVARNRLFQDAGGQNICDAISDPREIEDPSDTDSIPCLIGGIRFILWAAGI
jgi:hypothetical protein